MVKLLRFEVDFEREGTEQSYLHMCVLVMCRLVDMELHVLAVKLQLFWVVQKVFKFLVSLKPHRFFINNKVKYTQNSINVSNLFVLITL